MCGAAYLLVIVFLAGALLRRRRPSADAPPEVAPQDGRLRAGLLAWTVLITVGVTVLAVASFFADRSLAARPDGDALQVQVTGAQWWWRIQYLDPASGAWIETANELRLPQGRPVEIRLNASDVIHSFWIPNLSGKIDMIPGRTNSLYLTPRRAGWFRGQCAEFCGLQHANMALDVKVESPEAFRAWLAGQARNAATPTGPEAALGQQIVVAGTCAGCHAIRGAGAHGRVGPDLTHVASRRSIAAGTLPRTTGAIMGWISQPQAVKPGAAMPPAELSPSDTLAVVAYLDGLK